MLFERSGKVALLSAVFPAATASAQLPLSIEELLVEQRVTKLQGSVTFHNSARPALLVASGADPLPARLETRQQQETATSLRLRHGLTPHVEVHAAGAHRHSALKAVRGSSGEEAWRVSLGGNWLVSPDTSTPALLLQGSIDVLERGSLPGESTAWAATTRVGATAYRAIDPLVLSLAAHYQHSEARETALGGYRPGARWWLQPQVNFAVNYRVTLIGGVTVQRRASDRLDGRALASPRYLTGLNLGLGLLLGERSTLFAETRVATSGGDHAALLLDWLYRF